MAKQSLGERAVKTFYNSLVSANFSASTSNVYFVFFHLLGDASHEFAARVNLQHLRPSQRAALLNRLKGLGNFRRVFRGQRLSFFVTAGNVDNGQRVLENFAATREFVMW